jgi:5'-deoxynucleotidase YfbR-like HD superfamily hydrolase
MHKQSALEEFMLVPENKNTPMPPQEGASTSGQGTTPSPENAKTEQNRLFAFFERLKTMSSVQRFGTLPMVQSESVASHSYNVAILSLMIADFEPSLEIDREVLLRKALFHDFEETILSDIPHPIKHRFQGGKLGRVLKEIVPELIRSEIFKELPTALKDRYTQSAITAKDGPEGGVVAAADAMDIVITSLRELKMGNRYFQNIFEIGIRMLEPFETRFAFAKQFGESARAYRAA